MHLLFLTSRLPFPPNRGDRLRVYNFIRELSRHHQITLLSFVADKSEEANLAGLRPYCDSIQLVHLSRSQSIAGAAMRFWQPDPLQALFYDSGLMHKAARSLLRKTQFDVVYAHLFRMARYALDVPATYRILDLTDVISTELTRAIPYQSLPRRLVYQLEAPRIRRYEQSLVGRFDETWLISKAEKSALNVAGLPDRVVVVPNGVDTEHFHPVNFLRDSNTIVFVGHLSVPHNEDAATYLAHDILPLIRKDRPEARLVLIGAEPSEKVRRLANFPGTQVRGHVADLNRALNEAAVFVAPLRFAAGVQNKVLEAMAAGTPVVTTGITSEGIEADDGEHLLVADSTEEIAAKTLVLLNDRQRAQTMAGAARKFVVDNFRWDEVSRRMDHIEEKLRRRQ